jgi:hypothetical protein
MALYRAPGPSRAPMRTWPPVPSPPGACPRRHCPGCRTAATPKGRPKEMIIGQCPSASPSSCGRPAGSLVEHHRPRPRPHEEPAHGRDLKMPCVVSDSGHQALSPESVSQTLLREIASAFSSRQSRLEIDQVGQLDRLELHLALAHQRHDDGAGVPGRRATAPGRAPPEGGPGRAGRNTPPASWRSGCRWRPPGRWPTRPEPIRSQSGCVL